MFVLFPRRRRAAVRARAFPPAWRAIVEANAPRAARLTGDDRTRLEGLVQVFLDEKPIEGCGGLELTDEIRVTIAAHACLLLVHLDGDDVFPGLDVVRVYPHTYVAPARHVDQRVVVEGPEARLGESWTRGVVVLVWDAVRRVGVDGHNVVLHEFAHQLDQQDGSADGAPILSARSMYAAWARVLGHDFDALRHGESNVLDPYGATNPAEFFAVATEAFFERPRELRADKPELYDQLRAFYRQDPADRQ